MRYDLILKKYSVAHYKHIKLIKDCGKYGIYKVWKQTDEHWKDTEKGGYIIRDTIYDEEPIHYLVREKEKYCQRGCEVNNLEQAEAEVRFETRTDNFQDGLNTIIMIGTFLCIGYVIIGTFCH